MFQLYEAIKKLERGIVYDRYKSIRLGSFLFRIGGETPALQNDRQPLLPKISQIYDKAGINMPRLEKDNHLIDIDPFTIYGLFNKSSMKENF